MHRSTQPVNNLLITTSKQGRESDPYPPVKACSQSQTNDAMGERSIKVIIAGRTYPLKVSEKEEALVHEAVRKINEKVDALGAAYSVKDKQDLLAMAALQFASQYLEAQTKVVDDHSGLEEELAGLDRLLSESLA